MFFYKGNRSPVVFAEISGPMLMARQVGVWVDCDMVCVKPFRDLPPHIFGMEFDPGKGAHAGQINNAVLRLPSTAPFSQLCLNCLRMMVVVVIRSAPRYRRTEVAIRRMLGEKIGLAHMQFGATGPFPLTYFARQLGLDTHGQPRTVFYPLPYTDAPRLLVQGARWGDFTTEDTLGVHLWRMALTERSRLATPPVPSKAARLLISPRHFQLIWPMSDLPQGSLSSPLITRLQAGALAALSVLVFVLPPALGDIGTAIILALAAGLSLGFIARKVRRPTKPDVVSGMFIGAFFLMGTAFVVSAQAPSDSAFRL